MCFWFWFWKYQLYWDFQYLWRKVSPSVPIADDLCVCVSVSACSGCSTPTLPGRTAVSWFLSFYSPSFFASRSPHVTCMSLGPWERFSTFPSMLSTKVWGTIVWLTLRAIPFTLKPSLSISSLSPVTFPLKNKALWRRLTRVRPFHLLIRSSNGLKGRALVC